MKPYKKLLALSACALTLGIVATSCDDDPELPAVDVPVAVITTEPNTSIYDLKKQYWSDERNFADTVGLTPEGEHVVISGRVISCDSTGNIYKSLIIQDGTAALAISLDTTKIYTAYPVGEEVIIDMTGQYLGKYNGLFQMGKPQPYNGTYEISFMSNSAFSACAQRNGLPRVNDIDTVYTSIEQIKSWRSSDSIAKYQSQLICLKDVSFEGGGINTWAENGENTNRQLRDSKGNTITVRNSGYASFGRELMPAGTGTVVCILSYYGTDWQLLFRSAMDCHDFTGVIDEPSQGETGTGDGSADNPYTVGQVIAGVAGSAKWITGYIVGFVEGASLADGAHFNADGASQSNLLIAATPDETNVNNCVPIQLTYDTQPRNDLNLSAHPDNLGKQVSLLGDLQTYFNVKGLKTVTAYTWGDKGGDMPASGSTDDPDADKTTATFVKATKVTSGKSYLLVASGKMAQPLTKAYGYLPVADATVKDGEIEAPVANAYTFTAVEGGFTIKDSNSKYLYMKDDYNSFNLDESAVAGSLWKVDVQSDGSFKITNVDKNKSVQYDSQYTSFGAYADSRGTLPTLYEKK